MTDEEFMMLVKDDQLRFLSELFDRYQVRIYNYFKKITNDGSLSEDLTQSVFERIIHYRHSFSVKSSFQGWIFRIAKNILMDHYGRRSHIDNNIRVESIDLKEDDVVAREARLDEQKQCLKLALQSLKPEYREILVLTRLENLTYAEVGPVLGISESAIKARVYRAMKSLKRAFTDIRTTI